MQRTDITTTVVIATSLLIGFGAGYGYQPPIVFNGGLTVSALDNFDGHGATFIQSKPITISGETQPAYKAGDIADGGQPSTCNRKPKHTYVPYQAGKDLKSSRELEEAGFCKGDTLTFGTPKGGAVQYKARTNNAVFVHQDIATTVIDRFIYIASNTQPKE